MLPVQGRGGQCSEWATHKGQRADRAKHSIPAVCSLENNIEEFTFREIKSSKRLKSLKRRAGDATFNFDNGDFVQ